MDGKKQDYDHHQSHHFLNAYLKLHLNIIFILTLIGIAMIFDDDGLVGTT